MKKGFLIILLCTLLVGCSKGHASTPSENRSETMAVALTPAPSASFLKDFSNEPLKNYSCNDIEYNLPETWVNSGTIGDATLYLIDQQTTFAILSNDIVSEINFNDDASQNTAINALSNTMEDATLFSRNKYDLSFGTTGFILDYSMNEKPSVYSRYFLFQHNQKMYYLLLTSDSIEKLDYLIPILESLSVAAP